VTLPKSLLAAGLSLVLMVVGAIGPWAKVLGIITINGTSGGRDGWVVIGAAGIALVGLIIVAATRRRCFALIPLVAGAAGAATAAYDITDINALYHGRVASAQWGIYLALVGSIGLLLSSIWAIAEVRRTPQAATAASEEASGSEPPAAPAA
jgi:hypothetical protein